MTKTVRGRWSAGKIELLEPLLVPEGTEVEVVFDSDTVKPRERLALVRGMFRKTGAQMSTEEDFQEIKKIWEPRDL